MKFSVIETSTSERKAEIKALFDKMRPLLDNGTNFNQTYLIVTGKQSISTMKRGIYRDIREYAKEQGYDYRNHQWRRNNG